MDILRLRGPAKSLIFLKWHCQAKMAPDIRACAMWRLTFFSTQSLM
jgi:hypothetical protein